MRLEKVLLIIFCLVFFSEGKSYIEDLTLSLKQKEILDVFRERVSWRLKEDYQKKDLFLIRWLRARYYDVPKAEQLLFDHLKWREDNQMDKIHTEYWDDLKEKYKYALKQHTIDGKLTLYVNVGRWDLRKAAISGESKRFFRYIDKMIDEGAIMVREESEKFKNVTQGMLLLNLQGFNIVEHGCPQCIPLILNIIYQYEQHHPGLADKLILINTPAVGEAVVRVTKPALHPITRDGLFVYGLNKRVWSKALAKDYTLDQLPIELGGTLVLDPSTDYDDI